MMTEQLRNSLSILIQAMLRVNGLPDVANINHTFN